MTELVAEVEQVIHRLYNDPDPANKDRAQKWLIEVQNSAEAWQLCWLLLQHQKQEVEFFGASILNHKIVRAWREVSQEQYEQLKLELFKAILTYAQGPKIVRSKLCVTMADLVLYTIPDHWPNAVASMVETMRKASLQIGDQWQNVLVELLTVLPEEFDTISTSVISSKKGILRSELRNSIPTVLQFIESILVSGGNNELKSSAINCLSKWSQFGLPVDSIDGIISYLFQVMDDSELFDASTGTLTEIINGPDIDQYVNTVKKFLSRVLQLGTLVERKIEEDDREASLQICTLLVAALQANMRSLMSVTEEDDNFQQDSLASLQMLLDFTSQAGYYPVDEKCSQVTMRFWEELIETVTDGSSDKYQEMIEFYESTFSGLIQILPQKSQYPPEDSWDKNWDEDEQDDFIKCRDDISDLVTTFTASNTLQMELLQNLCSNMETTLRDSSPPWQPVEAILFLLKSFMPCLQNISTQQSSYLQKMLSYIPHMPSHPILTRTALSLLGSMGTWLRNQPTFLRDIIPMVLGALKEPSVAPIAALTFKDICDDCAEQLSCFSEQLMSACREALVNPNLEKRECTRLIAAICTIISTLPTEQLSEHLNTLAGSRIERLEQLAQQQPTPVNHPIVDLEVSLIGTLCHFVNPSLQDKEQHPMLPIMLRVWPSLKSLMLQWCQDEIIVDSICVCWNKAIRSLQEQYGVLVEDNASIILQCFTNTLHHKLLDTATQLVGMFGGNTTYTNLLTELLDRMCSICLNIFQADMRNNPDTLRTFFYLLTRTMKTVPVLLAERQTFLTLFEFGCAAAQLPELPTIKAVTSFLADYIVAAQTIELYSQMVDTHGKSLVTYILQAIAGASPRSHLEPLTDVLFSLNKNCITQLSAWLQELLQQDNFPSSTVSLMEKQNFASVLLRSSNKRALREKVNEFAILSRGYQGTGYPDS
ncbi:importin-13-like [Dysidea avara]|uniref:importin-13-like n=1 Tax=Dysidea avara TaxID=196820 RepID=UPI0033243BE7